MNVCMSACRCVQARAFMCACFITRFNSDTHDCRREHHKAKYNLYLNSWGSGLCPSKGIKKLEHDILETGFISFLG
jgi:hypothetical protein